MATILVADDRPENRLLVSTVLRACGHTVLEAANGDEASSCIARDRPDLVVLDIAMPGSDGIAFLRDLRRVDRRTPVVLYTASDPNAAMRELMRLYDVADVLPKPSEPNRMRTIVEGVLARSHPKSD